MHLDFKLPQIEIPCLISALLGEVESSDIVHESRSVP